MRFRSGTGPIAMSCLLRFGYGGEGSSTELSRGIAAKAQR
jgi:hypothetical protein